MSLVVMSPASKVLPTNADDREPSPKPVAAAVGAIAASDTISIRGHASATLDGAARDALRRANPMSMTDNREYGGLLYRDPKSGSYAATAPVRGGADSFDPRSVKIPAGTTLAGDYHTHGDFSKAGPSGEPVRTGVPWNDAFGSHKFSEPDVRGIGQDARGRPGYAGYLGTPSDTHLKYDPASRTTMLLHTAGRATAEGAIVGAAAGAVVSTASAIRHGRFTAGDARNVAASTLAGSAVGAVAGGIERSSTALTDRVAGPAIERYVSSIGTGEAAMLARTAASRIGGATIAGTVASVGFSAYENRVGLARGDSHAIGNVAGDAAVGLGAALTGAAAGAAIGSVVPVAGTIVGGAVGLAAGYAADKVLRAGGLDTIVGNAVAGGIDVVRGAIGE